MPLKALFILALVATAWTIPTYAPADSGEVIRVYDVPRTELAGLRRLGDFWSLDWHDQAVIMLVTPAGRLALETAGYRVETDLARHTERLVFLALDRDEWQDRGLGGIPGYPCYRTVDETHTQLAALAVAYPELARWESIGQTWEAGQDGLVGDDIFVLVLANHNVEHPQAPLLVMGAQHARELVTAEVAARFAEHLIHGYTSDPVARWLLDHREIHIVAQQNPDGRRRVETGQTSWRKNTNTSNCSSSSPGVDLNRNSSFLFGNFSSGLCASQIYRGIGAASEPETQAIQDYMDVIFDRQRPVTNNGTDLVTPAPDDARGVFLSLHSFGEMILLPWEGLGGQNENNAPNHDQLTILGRKLGFYTDYAVARWDLLPPAGGTTVDYAYGEFGVAAYTMELGTSFLQDCPSFEDSIWPDNLDALLYAAKAAERPYLAPWGPEITTLAASHVENSGLVVVEGIADSGGYFRGPVNEPPASDPVFPIASVIVSLDLPPHLAPETFSLDVAESAPVTSFVGTFNGPLPSSQPRLLFVQATDSEGNTGVASPIWLIADEFFQDRFEQP